MTDDIVKHVNSFGKSVDENLAFLERREDEETLDVLGSILHTLTPYLSKPQACTDFHSLEEELKKTLTERQQSLQRVLDLKKEKKAAITSVTDKISRMNAQMKELNDENNRFADLLRSETDSLVCRLMRGYGK